jgi:hypothetical protein
MDRNRTGILLAAGLAAGMLILLYFFSPSKTAVFLPCPFHLLTGLYCPGCGSLRAMHSLLHGRVADALSFNPLMVVSIPVLGLMLFNPRWMYRPWVPWVVFGILIGYGVARNIPVWPFHMLAPH